MDEQTCNLYLDQEKKNFQTFNNINSNWQIFLLSPAQYAKRSVK